MPSAKYCCSGSLDRFAKGRTTMEIRGTDVVDSLTGEARGSVPSIAYTRTCRVMFFRRCSPRCRNARSIFPEASSCTLADTQIPPDRPSLRAVRQCSLHRRKYRRPRRRCRLGEPDTVLNPFRPGSIRIALSHFALHFGRAAEGIQHAAELYE